MPRKKSKAVPKGNGPVPQVIIEEIRRIMSEAIDKYLDKWKSHYGLRPEYPKDKSNTNY